MTILPPSRGLANSAAMREAARRLDDAITANGGVLLYGEPGTGRELVARALHQAANGHYDGSVEELIRHAMRAVPTGRAFVVVECSSAAAIEERLFGTVGGPEAGGAEADCIAADSALHQANGGTLVLRHLPDMPARLQMRLARILRDGAAIVVNEDGTQFSAAIAVRPIATMDGASTEQIIPDLYRRVAQSTIEVPPLRHRREDIAGLCRYMLKDLCAAQKTTPKVASAQALELLSALPWRGNVRELEVLLRAIVQRVPGRMIRLADVLAQVRLDGGGSGSSLGFVYGGTLREARAKFERDYVGAVLEQHHGRMAEAARALGIQRTNLYRKVRQLSVKRRRPGHRATL